MDGACNDQNKEKLSKQNNELIDKTCDNTTCLNDETCDTTCLKYKTIDTISTNSYEKDNLFYLVYITTNNEYNKHILGINTVDRIHVFV
mgnify:CR=1 FL=1